MKIVIKATDIKVSTGHTPHRSGIGAHKNRRQDKKLRRREDRNAARLSQ